MHRSLKGAVATGLVLLAMGTPSTVTARQTSERTLYVSVMNPNGAPATDLKAEEFSVKEDGATRQVAKVERATEPIHFAVLTYTTPTVADQVRAAVRSFCQALLGEEPRTTFMFMDFTGAAVPLEDFSSDMAKIDAAIARIVPGRSQPALNEALIDVSKKMAALPANSRRVILVVNSEPVIETTNIQPKVVLEEVRKSRASVWSVALQEGTGRDSNRDQMLNALANNTGGRRVALLEAPLFTPLKGLLRSIAANTFSQYAVTYTGGDAKKSVKVTDVSVSRQGFFVLSPKWAGQ